ncbi:FecR family protein [Fulvivirga kasyanovii]|uniref:DUF4974 domain-containing protein n=1 Tax=Fulvivirga kasyanovii TaxID=396812 RepID=A0ABW9RQJ6_9BACT|nr:FecR domain-containing protein [Fulvivirga kasyanovii]MTI26444.1 DUF4974 domain-containing protein [Fulvivirga kasyanovii]
MNKNEFYDLLAKELSDTATEDDKARLRSLIEEFSLEKEYQAIVSNWQNELSGITERTYNLERVRQRVIRGIQRKDPSFRMGQVPARKQAFLSAQAFKVAASLLLLAAISIFTYIFYSSNIENTPEVKWIEKQTLAGQTTILTFKDGSEITLNGQSSIRFPENFGPTSREVFFSGEGYFDIATNPDKPFVVHMKDYSLKVLGTVFNINEYDSKETLQISLLEGKVEVGKNTSREKITLEPGKQVTFNRATSEAVVNGFDVLKTVGWKDKIFIFEAEPLHHVLSVLEKRYGVIFQYAQEVAVGCKINASFKDESIKTILKALEHATGIKYSTEDYKSIILSGNGCQ